MKLNSIRIKNFRCHEDLELDIDHLTILVGPNGSGKSAVIYALEWFFTGENISVSDFCGWNLQEGLPSDDSQIEVSVEFVELTPGDRGHLGKYGRKDTAHFTRVWKSDEDSKLFGNSLQGPGFAKVKNAKSADEAKEEYKAIREAMPELPAWSSRKKSEQALDEWESRPENQGRLEEVQDEDTSHLYGFSGRYVLEKIFRLIFVPAAIDISAQVGESGRGSILSGLVGEVAKTAMTEARSKWMEQNKEQMEALGNSIRELVKEATSEHEMAINRHLSRLVKGIEIVLRGESPDWDMRGDVTIQTDIRTNGQQFRLDQHGHGVQRAAVIAILQALVEPIEEEAQSEFRPSVLLALEEPEIYQHPIRARHFGRVLSEVSREHNTQVVMATHSPYFVRPTDFSSLRRFRASERDFRVASTSLSEVAQESAVQDDRVLNTLERNVSNEFSELYFAEKVVLVEGITDKVVVEALAEVLAIPLDAYGISVVEVSSKDAMRIPHVICSRLGIQTYVLVDGDYEPHSSEEGVDSQAKADANASRRRSTEAIVGWLVEDPESGAVYQFGDETLVGAQYTIFQHDLESELEKWNGFSKKLTEYGANLRGKKAKNPYVYKASVLDLGANDMPVVLRNVIEAIVRGS